MDYGLPHIDVVGRSHAGVENDDRVLEYVRADCLEGTAVLGLKVAHLRAGERPNAKRHVQVPRKKCGLHRVRVVEVLHFEELDRGRTAPVRLVPREENTKVRGVVRRVNLLRNEFEGPRADRSLEANARHVLVEVIPLFRTEAAFTLRGARVVRVRLRASLRKGRRSRHHQGAEVPKFLKQRVVRRGRFDYETTLGVAAPRRYDFRKAVPQVPFFHRGVQDVVEIQLGDAAVPAASVVELNALPKREDGALAVAVVRDFPLGGKRWLDSSVLAITDKALVDPVVHEQLVREVEMGIQWANRLEQPVRASRSHCHVRRAGKDAHVVEVVGPQLITGQDADQAAIEHVGGALAPQRDVERLAVHVAENLFPPLGNL
mmetsp:Transcript_13347/g.35404  ORF Transcript_13347/g.35404 Transcript_13347/m.35404 type:complete len:374 (-) Transcript_13347:611-1732(-)